MLLFISDIFLNIVNIPALTFELRSWSPTDTMYNVQWEDGDLHLDFFKLLGSLKKFRLFLCTRNVGFVPLRGHELIPSVKKVSCLVAVNIDGQSKRNLFI